jgi:hypothetical protein
MTRPSLSLLTATTALLALSGAAFAETVSVSPTGILQTANSVGGYDIQSGVVVSSTTNAAIELNATNAASNTITIRNGATVSGTQANGVIQMLDGSADATLTNAGEIDANGNVNAIANVGTSAHGFTIGNTGTISGSIDTSATSSAANSITNSAAG